MEELKKQLKDVKRDLRRLQNAIPALPSPQQLYDRIVTQCLDNYACTLAVTTLEEKLRKLRFSRRSRVERLYEIELLDLRATHLRLQFLFSRSQLRTLLSLPALLIAMKQMSKKFWSTLMHQEQEIDENQPLLMDLNEIEVVITDHL